ncbi:hypothetical protein K469DRAFT_712146 [Zopfia rhizophila CBS 207.26]|uniref:C3H1-type domain-containing protein n=1 Tax=Zopfia rhizophila CBS 207.26 TaxID=1314779 RepID=A0A6A6EQ25_9PEZI|nr:hypothetical protein K469DRAFT_712146 [Zopfia rhizophila CBS 207.26]
MLGDGEVDSFDTHLERFKLINQSNQHELQDLLKEYTQVLEKYKDLKNSYNELKDAKEVKKAEKVSNGKARNPYVLVLIDGNGYIFNDELVSAKEDGGIKAAKMVDDIVNKYLRETIPEASRCRVIVRIYADITSTSKSLAKSKLLGFEKRSLAPFTAGFTRSTGLYDFTDALDEDGTKFKVKEMFKLCAEDSACSHILFAACHDTSYLPLMVPYSGMKNKITLVKGAGFSPEFHQFSLKVTQFPDVFRHSDLHSASPSISSSDRNSSGFKSLGNSFAPGKQEQGRSKSILGEDGHFDTTSGADEHAWGANNGFEDNLRDMSETPKPQGQVPCKYFQKGFCRYGKNCKFQHGSGSGSKACDGQHITNGNDRSNITDLLPKVAVPGFIPLNIDKKRIDISTKPPTQDEWAIYNGRFRRQKPCNSYYLQGACLAFNCPFDHTELEPEALHALEYVVKCNPCPRKGECRAADCIYGHICQKDGCLGQEKGCRMKSDLHNVDPTAVSWVKAEESELVHGKSNGELIETGNNWL